MQLNKNVILKVSILIILVLTLFCGCFQQEEKIKEEQELLSIQQLIQNASSGGTIIIPAGTYYENIEINKPLSLIGEDKDTTILDGDYAKEVINIKSNNVRIINLTIRNSGGYLDNAGIRIDSNNNLIDSCKIYRTKTGIYFNQVKNNVVSNCFLYTNGEGIYLKETTDTVIKNCQICHNAFGLHLQEAKKQLLLNLISIPMV